MWTEWIDFFQISFYAADCNGFHTYLYLLEVKEHTVIVVWIHLTYEYLYIPDGDFKGVAYIVYSIIDDAKEAVNKLNNSTLNEKIIKVKLTRQRDNEDTNTQLKKESKSEVSLDEEKGGQKRKWKDKNQRNKANRNGRIIIRNLSFKVKYYITYQL